MRVPDFVPVVNHDDIRYYLEHVPGPWVLKPRQEASAIGIKKIHAAEELWPVLEQLGDKQSSFLLEQICSRRGLPRGLGGFRKRSGVCQREQVWQAAHERGAGRRNFYYICGRSREAVRRIQLYARLIGELIAALGLVRGVAHTEFIQAHADGHFYFLECAARVGGAYINEMVEAATGINLWREWARIEVAGGDGSYQASPVREEYAGVILSLARQENPDTSAYNDPEVFLRIKKHHHAGLILRSTDPQRVQALLESYAQRFAAEFMAVEPPRDKPTA